MSSPSLQVCLLPSPSTTTFTLCRLHHRSPSDLYQYPQLLKDEIEKQCDMLHQGIIRQSTSSFSAPVLFVVKKGKDMTILR
jgi:hypothetical protein